MYLIPTLLLIFIYLFAFFCLIMGIYSNFSKKPAFFLFSKKSISKEDISNLKMYNMAISILWLIYAVSFMAIGLIAYYYNMKIACILLIIFIIAISPVISYIYLLICNKYKITDGKNINKK